MKKHILILVVANVTLMTIGFQFYYLIIHDRICQSIVLSSCKHATKKIIATVTTTISVVGTSGTEGTALREISLKYKSIKAWLRLGIGIQFLFY